MVLASLKLGVIGVVLLSLWGQNATPARGSLTRSRPEARPTLARAFIRTIGCPTRASCRPHQRRHSHRASDLSADDESIFDSIDECSPFFSVDGSQQLEFDIASGLVTLSDDAGGLVAPAGAPLKSVGTFAADERTQQVFVRVAGTNGRYTLVVPSDSEQCILAAGAPNAADLRRSWFGSIEEEPEFPDRSEDNLGPT